MALRTSLRSSVEPPFGTMAVRSGIKEELFDSPIKSKEPSQNEKPIEGNNPVKKIKFGLEVADFIYGKLLKFLLVFFPLIVIYEWFAF